MQSSATHLERSNDQQSCVRVDHCGPDSIEKVSVRLFPRTQVDHHSTECAQAHLDRQQSRGGEQDSVENLERKVEARALIDLT